MLYHSLGCAIRKIGRAGFPQSLGNELEPGKMVTDPDYVWKLRGDERPSFMPYVGTVILRNGSAITDFISSATITSFAFICSDRVQSIVKSLEFGDTYFYDLKVKYKESTYFNYSLLHCLNNYVNQINYQQSEFKKLRIENNQWVGEQIKVRSYEDVKDIKNVFRNNGYRDWTRLEPSIISLNDNDKIVHDIFTIWGITYRVYVSEKLLSMFDKAKITGMQYNFDSEPLEIV